MPESYTYRYPNARSYALLPVNQQHGNFHWQGRSLRHGYIFGYKSAAPQIAVPAGVPPSLGTNSYYRQIDFQNSKVFQFNPPALGLAVSMMNVDSPENQADGGALGNTSGVGAGTFNLELFFDRTEEIARSTNGTGSEVWRDLGVQVDLFEFLKVISGGEASKLGTYTDPGNPDTSYPGTVQPGSLNHLTGMLLDAAFTGSHIMFNPFAVVFNPNLAIHVNRMLSFSFTYIRFTSDLVPTTVKVELSLEVFNMGTKSYVTSGGTAGPLLAGQTPATATAVSPPGTYNGQSVIGAKGGW